MARRKANYLNNRDMLKEIHKSKISFCEFTEPGYEKPSYIFNNVGLLETDNSEEIKTAVAVRLSDEELLAHLLTDEVQQEARATLATQLQMEAYSAAEAKQKKEVAALTKEYDNFDTTAEKTLKLLVSQWRSDPLISTSKIPQLKQQEQIKLKAKKAQLGKKLEVTSKKLKVANYAVDADSIDPNDFVYRVLTYAHIPAMQERKKTHKTVGDWHIKLNFIPFKHFIIRDGELVEVGRSHYKDGVFNLQGGSITNELAKMFLLLVRRYSERKNWRGYSYIDEMKGQALLQLSHMGLQFEESRSQNPFAYFTAVLSNSFTRVLNSEKQNQNLRDNLLEAYGQNPSFSRQLQYEEDARKSREDAENY
jgi:hypothetical protein